MKGHVGAEPVAKEHFAWMSYNVQSLTPGQLVIGTANGKLTLGPGTTPEQVYNLLRSECLKGVQEQYGANATIMIIAWGHMPNDPIL